MIASTSSLDALKRERPEWVPWLAVVEEVVAETSKASWDAAVPSRTNTTYAAGPLLAEATVAVSAGAVRRLFQRLVRLASSAGTASMRSLERIPAAHADVLGLFTASVRHDTEWIRRTAGAFDADPEALQAVAALVAVPFLQACNRRWSPPHGGSWIQGYCPVCAAWPAFAEVRGIERSRYFRCGRCGSEWHARALVCPYCGMDDHDDLVALVPGKSDAHAVVEACKRCRGYVKVLTRLQGCAPAVVMLEDLARVDLDVAALDRGYARPADLGCALGLVVSDSGSGRWPFRWMA
jgi:FdhE protein